MYVRQAGNGRCACRLRLQTCYLKSALVFALVGSLCGFAKAQNTTRSPSPSQTPTNPGNYLGPGTLSTGYLAVVFGIAFVLVSFTFCTSYCVRIWFLHRPGVIVSTEAEQRNNASQSSTTPPPPAPTGPPPVVVIQPDREISCAAITDPELREQMLLKFSQQALTSRASSRFVEIVINQDDAGELLVKQASLITEDAQQQLPQQSAQRTAQLSRWLCFWRRPQTQGRGDVSAAAEVEHDADVELGVQARSASVSQSFSERRGHRALGTIFHAQQEASDTAIRPPVTAADTIAVDDGGAASSVIAVSVAAAETATSTNYASLGHQVATTTQAQCIELPEVASSALAVAACAGEGSSSACAANNGLPFAAAAVPLEGQAETPGPLVNDDVVVLHRTAVEDIVVSSCSATGSSVGTEAAAPVTTATTIAGARIDKASASGLCPQPPINAANGTADSS